MIYITGDTHGDIERFRGNIFSNLTSDDKLIICGDFGFVIADESNKKRYSAELEKLDFLASLPFEILFVDGNHENHDRLSAMPEEKRYGGIVHRIRNNIFHLTRGEIFTIEDKTFFAMGGAYSIDKAFQLSKGTWWAGEQPSEEEYRNAINNLQLYNKNVDYIITHTCPSGLIMHMGHYPDPHDMQLTGFFDGLYFDVQFRNWFFGHFHTDKTITYKATACYTELYKID